MENPLTQNINPPVEDVESREESRDPYLEAVCSEILTVQELIPEIDSTDLSQDYPGSPIQRSSREEFVEAQKGLVNLSHAYAKYKAAHITERPELAKAFESFDGQVVVDLGAGQYTDGYDLANIGGARAYVAVEAAHAVMLARRIAVRKNAEISKMSDEALRISWEVTDHVHVEIKGIPASVVSEDMLTFLHRLPDSSVSIFCSGIDRIIVSNAQYRKLVAEQIERVLSPEGAYIGDTYSGHIELEEGSERSIACERVQEDEEGIIVYKKILLEK